MALRRDEKAGHVEPHGRPKAQTVAAAAALQNREGRMPHPEWTWPKRRGVQTSCGTRERLDNASFSGEMCEHA